MDWEQRKLREVLKVNSGRDYKHLNQGSVPVYGTGGYMLSVDDKLSDIDGIGIGRKGTIDKPQYLKAPYWTVDTLFYMTSFENNDLLFLLTLSQKINWKRMDESTGVPSLSKTVIENVIQYFPVYDEQIKIGKFFKQLDDTIALHQQRLAKLKELKKGFLFQILNRKVRFNGFTDEWKQLKLGDMSESFEYGLNASATKYDGENKYIRITDIDDKSHQFLLNNLTSPNIDLSLADNYLLKEGDILFARTGASVGKSYKYNIKDGKVYYAGFLIRARIKSEYDSNFIFQNTHTTKYNNFVRVTSQRSGQPGINAQEYSNYSIKVPEKEEQTKISTFFEQLDVTISLNQNKIDKLNKLKKSFLQKMFI